MNSTIYKLLCKSQILENCLPQRATLRGGLNWVGLEKFQRCVQVSVFIIMSRIHLEYHIMNYVRCDVVGLF